MPTLQLPPFLVARMLRVALGGLLVVLLQWLVLNRLLLWGAYPDAVLLFVAYLGLAYGRRAGLIGGFASGLLLDALLDSWGLHALAKSLIGFLVGLFALEEPEAFRPTLGQAFLGGLVLALVHNGLLVALLALAAGTRTAFMVEALWLGSALYTAFLSALVVLVRPN
ncbi:rod shape-determining protein MreD [Rhodothermus profundi]|uniref:Rod shape-determining protein MreD n=1 Tax=Rhodothermus profundi TaxID=633813 RepID=A0A1M6QC59_9BACT|nr:rod shape-determining protein MreD [Rhodothermus profundi]SHK17663.1 rod shape-determining protein MreD [Rhodothermus profundi]